MTESKNYTGDFVARVSRVVDWSRAEIVDLLQELNSGDSKEKRKSVHERLNRLVGYEVPISTFNDRVRNVLQRCTAYRQRPPSRPLPVPALALGRLGKVLVQENL